MSNIEARACLSETHALPNRQVAQALAHLAGTGAASKLVMLRSLLYRQLTSLRVMSGAAVACLVIGCGANAGENGAGVADLTGGSQFVDDPSVRFAQPAVDSAIESDCMEAPREISVEDARELGVDVDGDIAALERTWSGTVNISRERNTQSTLHVRSRRLLVHPPSIR